MPHDKKIGAGIIALGLAAASLAGALVITKSIESTIEESAKSALTRENIPVGVTVEGRDVVLSGTSESTLTAAVSALHDLPWVHRVRTQQAGTSTESTLTSTIPSGSGVTGTTRAVASPSASAKPSTGPSTTATTRTDPSPVSSPPTFAPVRFVGGGTAIAEDENLPTAEIASLLRNNTNWKVALTGHTDNGRTAAERQALGLTRAKVIRAQLIAAGVPSQRIIIQSQGSTAPVATNATKEGRALNRRVEIVIQVEQS